MEALRLLALILLPMVGYSCGAAIAAGRGRSTTPELLDLSLLLALWFFALFTYPAPGKLPSILIWMTAAAILSSLVTRIRIGPNPAGRKKTVETRISPGWRGAWRSWKSFAAAMGNYQGRLLLAAFYFLVITPWGLTVRLFRDPLRTRLLPSTSYWSARIPIKPDVEEAQRQF